MSNEKRDTVQTILDEAIGQPVKILHDLVFGGDRTPTPEERIATAIKEIAKRP